MSQNTMRAAVALNPETALQLQTLPLPVIEAGQVLVKISASCVNPLDTKISSGQGGHARQPLPAILGMDLAGVIEAIGADVTAFQIEAWQVVLAANRVRWRNTSPSTPIC
jgi:NADPH:quinone reductase